MSTTTKTFIDNLQEILKLLEDSPLLFKAQVVAFELSFLHSLETEKRQKCSQNYLKRMNELLYRVMCEGEDKNITSQEFAAVQQLYHTGNDIVFKDL